MVPILPPLVEKAFDKKKLLVSSGDYEVTAGQKYTYPPMKK